MIPTSFVAVLGLLSSVADAASQEKPQFNSHIINSQTDSAEASHSQNDFSDNQLYQHSSPFRSDLARRGSHAVERPKILKSVRPAKLKKAESAVDYAVPGKLHRRVGAAASDCGLVATETVDVTVFITPTARSDDDEDSSTATPRASTRRTSSTKTRTSNSTGLEAGASASLRFTNSTLTASTTRSSRTQTRSPQVASSRLAASLTAVLEPTPKTNAVVKTTAATLKTVRLSRTRAGDADDSTSTLTKSHTSDEPCEEELTTITSEATRITLDAGVIKAASTRPSSTVRTTVTRVIDVSMTPVVTSALTVTPSRPTQPTRTVDIDDAATGAPIKDRTYCGVKGEPAGTYFIAEFIENRSGVPVTLEGCYEFCDSVMESTDGCQAYRFYYNEFGAPRCALYGMPVPWIVRDLDNDEPYPWYDLECGSPTKRLWATRDI